LSAVLKYGGLIFGFVSIVPITNPYLVPIV